MIFLEPVSTRRKMRKEKRVNRLLLCTDMDRTIIPNGEQREHQKARVIFRELCSLPEVELAYVTGRHLQLLLDAIERYQLPEPDYAVTDVGTRIYRKTGIEWCPVEQWRAQIAADWRGKSYGELKDALQGLGKLTLQEKSKQSDYKLSYYFSLQSDLDEIVSSVAGALERLGVNAAIVPSIDEVAEIGLLDILPQHATKLHAILFLQRYLGYDTRDVLFAGDSGNDLMVLTSEVCSILVANASEEVRGQALQSVGENGNADSLFIAGGEDFPLGGNYAAGVVQGVLHYKPELKSRLNLS